ncbi:MAG TPA: hypothetical protein VIQ28_05370 [Burkholderiales bacterium]|jgi:hypothetical protein
MPFTTLTPQDIALAQLEKALRLYVRDEDLICVVTLAGAAEEILGKLARVEGKTPSLERRVAHKMEMFSAIFPNTPIPPKKAFVSLSNQGRDAMKHLTTTDPITIDIEEKSGRLLARAVENYVLLFGSETPLMRRFQSKRLRAFRLHGVA